MSNIFDFVGGSAGEWSVNSMHTVSGEALALVSNVKIALRSTNRNEGIWTLAGIRSNLRYTEKSEEAKLVATQAGLGRPEAACAALIPIRKSEVWWSLAQDERREIFEAGSHHIKTGMKYLPAIARKLYHCRDLNEPFDFLTWFEYAPAHANAFEELVAVLRETEEWKYVEREVDIRLTRSDI